MTSVLDITERKARERVRQLTVDTLAKLNEERDLRAAVAGLLETVREVTGADAAGLRLRAEEVDAVCQVRHRPAEFVRSGRELSVQEPLVPASGHIEETHVDSSRHRIVVPQNRTVLRAGHGETRLR